MIDEYLQNWIKKAENDLRLASHELKLDEDEIVTDAVCFHCQQAVEKLLKAYLIYRKVDFGRTHDLELLIELCVKEEGDFSKIKVGNLSDYAVGVRYPDDFYLPSVIEARQAYKIALAVKDFVYNKLKLTGAP